MKITFIGGGNMAVALIGGLKKKGFSAAGIQVVEPNAEARERLTDSFGVRCAPAVDAAALASGGMAEARVGGSDRSAEFGVAEGVADEGAHHPEGGVLVAEARERGDLVTAHLRHGFGNIKSTVTGKARQHRLAEAKNRGLPPRGYVPHVACRQTVRCLIRHRR